MTDHPRHSAFAQHMDMVEKRKQAMEAGAGFPPAIPDVTHVHTMESRHRTTPVRIDQLEEWVEQLEILSDMPGGEQLAYLANEIRSHLRG